MDFLENAFATNGDCEIVGLSDEYALLFVLKMYTYSFSNTSYF